MEVTIERILPGGLGLAHADGKTIMVALAAPGDRLRVRIDREKGKVAFASIEEIIEPSADRIEPPCPYFGRCGGCDFQQLSYGAQLAAKKEIIKDCLHRIAKIETVPDFEIVSAPNQWQYRARAQWQYDAERKRLGYFESGSRRVCDVAECAVLVPELQESLADLRVAMAGDLLPGDARSFRAIAGDDAVAVAPRVRAVREGNNNDIQRTIAGDAYALNAASFFQTNVGLIPALIDEAIGREEGETAIELYCGIGLFTLPLARRFKNVSGVEDDAGAVKFARQNLTNAKLINAQVEKTDVGKWMENVTSARRSRGLKRQRPACNDDNPEHSTASGTLALQSIDFLLLDPPRTGAESRVISGIINLKPKRICYVSCDPATLARDLKKLLAGGYSLDSIVAFDMFPQTHHVETVVHLSG